jgi:hypothetical protein
MRCTKCGINNVPEARFCVGCGSALDQSGASRQRDSTGGIIPYKNPPALAAYYLGLFSILPVVGLVLGLAAVPLGIMGLRRRKAMPEVKGTAHAWVGIGCGSLTILLWGACVVMIIVAAAQS